MSTMRAGQRVMKWVRRQGGQIDVTVYVDGVFEHHRRIAPSGVQGEQYAACDGRPVADCPGAGG